MKKFILWAAVVAVGVLGMGLVIDQATKDKKGKRITVKQDVVEVVSDEDDFDFEDEVLTPSEVAKSITPEVWNYFGYETVKAEPKVEEEVEAIEVKPHEEPEEISTVPSVMMTARPVIVFRPQYGYVRPDPYYDMVLSPRQAPFAFQPNNPRLRPNLGK